MRDLRLKKYHRWSKVGESIQIIKLILEIILSSKRLASSMIIQEESVGKFNIIVNQALIINLIVIKTNRQLFILNRIVNQIMMILIPSCQGRNLWEKIILNILLPKHKLIILNQISKRKELVMSIISILEVERISIRNLNQDFNKMICHLSSNG